MTLQGITAHTKGQAVNMLVNTGQTGAPGLGVLPAPNSLVQAAGSPEAGVLLPAD